jgi:hypothetical protein
MTASKRSGNSSLHSKLQETKSAVIEKPTVRMLEAVRAENFPLTAGRLHMACKTWAGTG